MGKSAFALLFLGILAGFGAGVLVARPAEHTAACESRLEDLRAKLSAISEVDLEEYARLKAGDDKLKKAQEILAKMVQIFLADLGLRLSMDRMATLASPTYSSGTAPQASLAPPPAVASAPPAAGPVTAANTAAGLAWRAKQKEAHEIRSESDVRPFLDSVAIKDLSSELRGTVALSGPQVTVASGTYHGWITFDDSTRQPQEVRWSLRGTAGDGRAQGREIVQLINSGGRGSNSRTSGNGELHAFRSFTGSEDSIILEASPGSDYLHLFYVRQMDRFVGNYYRKVREGEFQRTGTVTMTRTAR